MNLPLQQRREADYGGPEATGIPASLSLPILQTVSAKSSARFHISSHQPHVIFRAVNCAASANTMLCEKIIRSLDPRTRRCHSATPPLLDYYSATTKAPLAARHGRNRELLKRIPRFQWEARRGTGS